MKLTASANAKSKSNSVPAKIKRSGYFMCIDNREYPASLEVGKVYRAIAGDAGIPNWIRVIDESGDDYLYPAKRFVPMEVPAKGKRALAASAKR